MSIDKKQYILETIDIKGNNNFFYYKMKTSPENYRFCISDGYSCRNTHAYADFTLIENYYKFDIEIVNLEYKKKGIPEAFILEGKKVLGKDIISLKDGRHSWSENHWDKLVKIGKAKKLDNENYITI